jgi:hypothetical protein
MHFDNQKTTIRVSLWKMFLAIFFAVLIIFFLATDWFNRPFLGLERYELILISAGLYIFIMAVIYLLDLNYFYFNDDGDHIIIRYYPMRPLGRKKRAVQIAKISLAGYEIKPSLFGLRKSLILHQKTKKGTAKYPAISITSLNKKEVEIITGQLRRYVRT